MDKNIVELQVVSFSGPHAVLSLSNDTNTKFVWPLCTLPSTIKEGDNVKIKILTENDFEAEHQTIARKLLEEMIN